jgi:alkanesulfonate monooxygenase SsuD/methylene tetrahydromethanopterin reductase-like flavin-dependent oxidoreductase (luciferase family)
VTGVSLFHPFGDFEATVEAVNAAEAAGFDGCLFGEHHGAPGNDRPQLLILLAALAARTKRIKLGTSILLSALADPVQIAESAAMVDVISGGRLILGLGMGYQPQDFRQFGIPFAQRASRFEESVAVIDRALRDERFSFAGRRFRYDDIAVYPRPVQRPRPPVWLAAWSIAGAERAGRLGDAYVTDPIQNLHAVTAFERAYRASARAAGRDSGVVIMREILCAATRQEAIDRYAEGLLRTYRYYFANGAFMLDYEPWAATVTDARDLTFEMLTGNRIIYGSPEDCLGQLEHWVRTLAASHVQLTVPYPPSEATRESQLRQIAFLGETVVATLRAFSP